MPPKNNKKQVEKQKKREEEKRKERIVEDKTFGLKNKNKSAQVQKYIRGVQKQVQGDKNSQSQAQFVSKEEKKKSQADQALLSSLLRGLSSMPQPKAEEVKAVVCSAYKQGMCQKGAACKFSHDLSQEVTQEKPDLYTDNRTCVKTDTTCQYYFEAVQSSKFGWFWKCPNGDTCIYRHALPPDYVLKTEEEKNLDMLPDEESEPFERILDEERRLLPPGGTPLTKELFMKWLEENEQERQAAKEQRCGRPGRSGLAMFTENPDAFKDEEGAYDEYEREEEQEENKEEENKEEEPIQPQAKEVPQAPAEETQQPTGENPEAQEEPQVPQDSEDPPQ